MLIMVVVVLLPVLTLMDCNSRVLSGGSSALVSCVVSM